MDHFKQAERLDPRSVGTLRALGTALLYLRRYPEAREAIDRGLALAPANPLLIEYEAMSYLGEGDLAGARAVLEAAPKDGGPPDYLPFTWYSEAQLPGYWKYAREFVLFDRFFSTVFGPSTPGHTALVSAQATAIFT